MTDKATYPIDYTQGSSEPKTLMAQAAGASQAIKEKVAEVADRSAEMAKHSAEQIADLGNQVEEKFKDLPGALRQSMKDQPLTTMAAAAAVAFVLGALWRK